MYCTVLSKSYHSRNLTRDELLLHLLGECILECEVVPPVYEQLVLQVLRGMEIFARGLLAVTPALQYCQFMPLKLLHNY